MPRHKTGGAVCRVIEKGNKTKKIWYARIQFFEDDGKRKQVHRKPEYNSESSARSKAREMLAELAQNPKSFDASEMTFNDLADFYQATYLVEPEYRDGKKVAGLRSKYDCENRLKVLREFFGKKKLRTITHVSPKDSNRRRAKYERHRQERQATGAPTFDCNGAPRALSNAPDLERRGGE
jgi:hypothetical protein